MGVPRLVFDTNTLISGLLLPDSQPAHAVKKGLHEGKIIVSSNTLNELAEVLSRAKFNRYISLEDRKEYFRYFARVVEKIEIIRKVKSCRDPKDDKFLEVAINGEAEIIINGDKDLLILHPYQSIQIVTPIHYLNNM
ncbi:putative toxin-antitoxin system toxin component, PIN family [Cardiobacterium sp. AH-315-I02]|nr:putative toxin-antitoxin system toxin component, PIN family [Cardiobacterium sp. AH-315-I02]